MEHGYGSKPVWRNNRHKEFVTVANGYILRSSTASAASGSVPPPPPTYASSPLLRALLGFTPRREETRLGPSRTSAASSPNNDEDLMSDDYPLSLLRDLFADEASPKSAASSPKNGEDLMSDDYPLSLLRDLFADEASPNSAASSPKNGEDLMSDDYPLSLLRDLFAEEGEEIETQNERQEDQFSDPDVERRISAIKAVSDVAYEDDYPLSLLHGLFMEAEDNDYPPPLLRNLFMEAEDDGHPPPLLHDISMAAEDVQPSPLHDISMEAEDVQPSPLHDISMEAEDVQPSLPQGWTVEAEDALPSLPQGWIVEAEDADDGAPPPVNQHVIDVEEPTPPQDMDEPPVPPPRERFSVLWLWEEAINVDNLVLIWPDFQFLFTQWLLTVFRSSSMKTAIDAMFNPVVMAVWWTVAASYLVVMCASHLTELRVVTLCGLPLTMPRITLPGGVELVALLVNGYFACTMIYYEVGMIKSIASRAIFGYCVRVIKKVTIRFFS